MTQSPVAADVLAGDHLREVSHNGHDFAVSARGDTQHAVATIFVVKRDSFDHARELFRHLVCVNECVNRKFTPLLADSRYLFPAESPTQ